MKRRRTTSRKPATARRTTKPKQRIAAKGGRRASSSVADLQDQIERQTRELNEARERETATAEVLRVIGSSPGELQPVFQAMLEKATRICDAKFGSLHRFDGASFQVEAQFGTPPEFAGFQRQRGAFIPQPGSHFDQAWRTKRAINSADEAVAPVPGLAAKLGGARSALYVPMIKEDAVVGTIVIYRQEVRPFTDKQIDLVKNFASQAVIAIENTRLLNELRQRTTDLTEALEQQKATSEVLHVIAKSSGELEPIFQAIMENALRICEAKFGTLFRYDGRTLHPTAQFATPVELIEAQARYGNPTTPGSLLDRVMRKKQVEHDTDAAANPSPGLAAKYGGARSILGVPMLKDDELVGVIIIYRQEVRPFTDKQIALVKNFAAQAVIAIENARLLNELQQSLERLTATSQVLQVISSSPGDLEPVFRTMLENATRICSAHFGVLHLSEGDAFRTVALHNAPPEYVEAKKRDPMIRYFPSTSALTRLRKTRRPVQIADIRQEDAYSDEHTDNASRIAFTHLTGVRTLLAIPMLDREALMGAIMIYRQEVQPFNDEQIELMQNFAAQAVIAIENARLLNQLRERTDQLEMQSQELAKLNQELEQRVANQVGEIERMSRLRRFLPPQVADLIVASGTEKQLESHRREITALFCDLRGFTGFTESADAEDVMALLREYHAAIGDKIIKYSGTLERYAGDGVMVVFNDPVLVENPALQAVLMALEMREAMGALTETWRRLGHDVGFGIGIAHGFATLGTIGFEGRFDYAAIGTVSNVASRLCDEAKPGQILISPRVLVKVENAVKVEPVGEFELKGIRRSLAAYNVLSTNAPR